MIILAKKLDQNYVNFYDISILGLWIQLFDGSNSSVYFEITFKEKL